MNNNTMSRRAALIWLLVVLVLAVLFICANLKFGDSAEATRGVTALPEAAEAKVKLTPLRSKPAPFNPRHDDYVLRAWSRQGMLHISDADPAFSMLQAGSVLEARLIRRGQLPRVMDDDSSFTIHWKILAPKAAGGKELGKMTLAPDAESDALNGVMHAVKKTEDGKKADKRLFTSGPIPLMPYTDKGAFIPYPLVEVSAVNRHGKLLARTVVTLPVSTELGCKNCHTGNWKSGGKAGISKTTAMDILTVHDFKNGTTLVKDARAGSTVYCESCHMGGEGMAPNLSAAMHGAHAIYLPGKAEDTCNKCHPSAPEGATRLSRDIHSAVGISCVRCHGVLEDHALSLLKAERNKGNEASVRLMSHIKARQMPVEIIHPREPWINQPDCTGCHNFSTRPNVEKSSAFNRWSGTGTKEPDGTEMPLFSDRTDDTGAMNCAVCHGSAHALFPASNPYDENRDNLPALQYQKDAWVIGGAVGHKRVNCQVCHTTDDMGVFAHHGLVKE